MEGRSVSLKTGTDMLENGDRSLYESARSVAAASATSVLSVLTAFLGFSVELPDAVSVSVESTRAAVSTRTTSSSTSVFGAKKCTTKE